MSEYKPTVRTLIIVLGSFFLVVLPAIWFSGMGYIWLIERGLNLDTNAKPAGILDGLVILASVLPIVPIMLMAILMSGIPWIFVMSRTLSWADIQYFMKQKGPRLPFLSDWLDRLWQHMIGPKRPESPTSQMQ